MDESPDLRTGHSSRRNAEAALTLSVPTPEKRVRMVVLGASGVGKTQLVSRFLDRPFKQSYLPTAEEFHRTKYIIRGHIYQLDILDMAGQLINPVMQNLTLLTGDLFLVVYSVTDRGSWERAKDLVSSVEEVTRDPERMNKCIERSFKNLLHANGGTSIQCDKFENGIQDKTVSPKTMARIPILMVGNKCDASNVKVQSHEPIEWLKQRPQNATSIVEHMLASAKTNYNVQALYGRLFAMSHLPRELSPNMHRRVSNGSCFVNKMSLGDGSGRPRSSEFTKSRKRSLFKRRSGCRSLPSSGSSSSSDNDDGSESPHAISSIYPNQRRPSVDTEVLLAFTKIRSYTSEQKSARKHTIAFAMEKLRKKMNKATAHD